MGFGGTFAVVDHLEVAFEGLADFALLMERLPLAEFRIVDVERAGVGASAVVATDKQQDREDEDSANHGRTISVHLASFNPKSFPDGLTEGRGEVRRSEAEAAIHRDRGAGR